MRRKLLFTFTALLFFLKGYSQTTYGNEWINYSQTYLKFPIAADGVYRITYDALVAAQVPVTTLNGSSFQVFARGKAVPVYASTSGILGTNDYIEFYATHNSSVVDSAIYADPSWLANKYVSLFNDTISYFLTWSTKTTALQYSNYINTLAGHPAAESWCWYTSTNVYGAARATYYQGKPAFQGQQIFNSDFSNGEGYSDASFNHTAISKPVYTPYVYANGSTAKLNTTWLGKFPLDHYLDLGVGGQVLQSYHYFGFQTMNVSMTLPSNSLLTSGNTNVTFSTANSTAYNNTDANGVSYVQIEYPRQFNAGNTSLFSFSLDPGATNKYLEIYNFNAAGSTPILYDATNHLRITAIESAAGDTLKFQIPPSNTTRKIFVVANTTAGIISPVNKLYPVHFTDFSSTANQGDFIIISHPFFNDGSANDYVKQYQDFKNSTGKHAIVVNILDLYDEFAYGVNLHPLSIRNFSHLIKDKWTTYPNQQIFLIGKGIEMFNYNTYPSERAHCYVPTYGYPGSDVMLTATNFDPTPQIPIGRIPALTTDDVRIYLKKAEDFVSMQAAPQTIANKAWMKHIIHLGGGDNLQDQEIFQYYLNGYIPLIDTAHYGGTVTSFFKTSSDPIQQATSATLDSLINNGVSLITFFGHSSYNSFDFNIGSPTDYNNYRKYPVLISNGCLVGNMFNDGTGISDEFVFAEDRGTIAFIAAATFSVSNSLDAYTHDFYSNLSYKNYNQPLGTIMKGAVRDMLNAGASGIDTVVMEQMCLNGDPGLLINSHPKPDYVIEPQSISFNPTVVSAGIDSFKLQVIVTNIGKAITDSIYVDVTRFYPNGQSYLAGHKKIAAPDFLDTVVFNIKTLALNSLGLNKFDIKVDATNKIDEESENNNELSVDMLILSDDIIPTYPYEFSIVNKQGVTLKASTVNSFAAAKQYVFEIDTTQNFNSPIKQRFKTTQVGGVVQWKPILTMRDSTVYYWRTSVDTIYHNSFSWHNSSFIYINNSSDGWNQSHYFQYLEDSYANIQLPATRKFKYTNDVKTIGVFNAVSSYLPGGPISWDQINYYINGTEQAGWTCGFAANLLFAVIDSSTGLEWQTVLQPNGYGQYGNIQCYPQNLNAFYFDGTGQSYGGFQGIIDFINLIPKGDYVLVMSLNDPQMYNFPQNLKDAFHTLGAINMDTVKSLRPYVLFSKKGSTTYPVKEIIGKTLSSIIDTNFYITGSWDRGYIESTLIGPATKWTSLHWKKHEVEKGADQISLSVYGVDNNNKQTLLFPNVVHSDTVISGINTKLYPYLMLKLNSQDTLHRTPIQLDAWRINFQGVPEAAINPFAFYTFTDTVALQQNMKLNVAIQNVSDYSMDSLTMKYTITDSKNVAHVVYQKLDSLRKNDTLHTNFSFPVTGGSYSGINNVTVEVNPYEKNHQNEQYHFNNVAATHFTTTKDLVNPLLDVTFDGVHILDGDIVSAKPEIMVRLKDDNKSLPLNDTSLFKIYYVYLDAPNVGKTVRVVFDNVNNVFTPADPNGISKSNMAQATLKPTFPDGHYQLMVQGYDRTGNAAGAYAYQISFEIINKSMISNVLTYPNPFTTKTRFVFVLTGSEIPSFMKIQIMTVTGKVVKEIFKEQLGTIHIGRNISDYAWDGTDQYGDPLANGLYLYKVVTNLDNKQIDKYEVNGGSTDKYFKHNIGKMYFMR